MLSTFYRTIEKTLSIAAKPFRHNRDVYEKRIIQRGPPAPRRSIFARRFARDCVESHRKWKKPGSPLESEAPARAVMHAIASSRTGNEKKPGSPLESEAPARAVMQVIASSRTGNEKKFRVGPAGRCGPDHPGGSAVCARKGGSRSVIVGGRVTRRSSGWGKPFDEAQGKPVTQLFDN